MFTAELFTTAKIWKQPKCPSINKWTKKMWYIYNEHYSAMLLLLLSRFSHVRLRATPQTAANQAPRPWDSPGKNTGVGCHFLLQCMKVKSEREVAQSCLALSDPMDCSPPGSSVHGIFQARVLEWGAIAFSKRRCTSFKSLPTFKPLRNPKKVPCTLRESVTKAPRIYFPWIS